MPKNVVILGSVVQIKRYENYMKGTVIRLHLYQHFATSTLRTHLEMPRCSSEHTPLQAHSPLRYGHELSKRSLLSLGTKSHPCHLRSSPPGRHQQQRSRRNLHHWATIKETNSIVLWSKQNFHTSRIVYY